MEKDDTTLLECMVKPFLGININKRFSLKSIDKLLSIKSDKKEANEVVKTDLVEENYVYDDEIEDERIRFNYVNIIHEFMECVFEYEKFDLIKFNSILRNKYGDDIFKNGDYYSMLVHLSQKSEYVFDEIIEKQDTFLDDYMKDVLKEYDENLYKGLKLKLIFDSNERITYFEDSCVTNIVFKLDYSA